MATCPHCGHILSDDWLKRNAASLMGKSGGKSKARNNAKAAAQARWDKERADEKEIKNLDTFPPLFIDEQPRNSVERDS